MNGDYFPNSPRTCIVFYVCRHTTFSTITSNRSRDNKSLSWQRIFGLYINTHLWNRNARNACWNFMDFGIVITSPWLWSSSSPSSLLFLVSFNVYKTSLTLKERQPLRISERYVGFLFIYLFNYLFIFFFLQTENSTLWQLF
jgi:hypothetical protein